MTPHNTELTILSTTIRQDDQGRYCLNDCHKASGGEPNKAPSEWVKNKQTKALASELGASGNSPTPLSVLNDGKNNGTYACEEMVLAYAMWISPKFHAECLRSLLAMMKGQIPNAATKPKRIRKTPIDTRFIQLKRIALASGKDEGQAVICANTGVLNETGYNALEMMGIKALPIEGDEHYYTPTDLGAEFGMSGREVNQILKRAGLQIENPAKSSTASNWLPTEMGKRYGRMQDGVRSNGKGSTQTLMWKKESASFLRPFARTPAQTA